MYNTSRFLLSGNNCTHVSLTLLCACIFTTDKLETLIPFSFTLFLFGLDFDNLFECPGLWIVG